MDCYKEMLEILEEVKQDIEDTGQLGSYDYYRGGLDAVMCARIAVNRRMKNKIKEGEANEIL